MLVDTEFRGVAGTLVLNAELDQKVADEAYIETMPKEAVATMRKAPDEVTILIAQPTNDVHDPLSGSQGKKWLILPVVLFCAITPDMQAGFGIPVVPAQAVYWNISVSDSGCSMSGNVFVSPHLENARCYTQIESGPICLIVFCLPGYSERLCLFIYTLACARKAVPETSYSVATFSQTGENNGVVQLVE
ncbi:uncharacterized protein A1O5_05622 [Cladophialophora psammophila CBS 110553]|uniref:Uncharacterized protein n=1 Tax=Cladophialophora psammophila CBS 110553 TaxID=1182543 RepID=W9WUD4_9EURO|nr:uncharacterized protein A1O5_05622 [Cladophialophora psammophila CBS 110553]EXJ71812.1 hypothetical protein A1O5_05622 [Cladophialophora psammophila CBS 110553]